MKYTLASLVRSVSEHHASACVCKNSSTPEDSDSRGSNRTRPLTDCILGRSVLALRTARIASEGTLHVVTLRPEGRNTRSFSLVHPHSAALRTAAHVQSTSAVVTHVLGTPPALSTSCAPAGATASARAFSRSWRPCKVSPSIQTCRSCVPCLPCRF